MEELFCIGCGAQIQTEDKEKQVSHLLALLKGREQVSYTASAVSVFVITMRLWMSTSLMMNF